jgi:hypothetical protein
MTVRLAFSNALAAGSGCMRLRVAELTIEALSTWLKACIEI